MKTGKKKLPYRNEAYIQILLFLEGNNQRQKDIAFNLKKDKSLVKKHLDCMIKDGLIKLYKFNKIKSYGLSKKGYGVLSIIKQYYFLYVEFNQILDGLEIIYESTMRGKENKEN